MTVNDDIDPDDLIRTMEPSQIDKFLPKRTYEILLKKNKSIEDGNCTICIDFLKNGEMLREIPLCGHVYHADCLLNWLLVNEVCPNCKNEVSIFTLRAYFESMRQSRSGANKRKDESRQRPGTSQEGIFHQRSLSREPAPLREQAANQGGRMFRTEDARVPIAETPSEQDWELSSNTNEARRQH